MQIISNDQTLKNGTLQYLQGFNSQSLATQAKKAEQLVFMMAAIKKTFDILVENIVELSTKYESLKKTLGSYDGKGLEELKQSC